MSSAGFETTLDLRLAASHLALRWLYAIHILPLIGVAFAMQPGAAMIAVAAAFGGSWFWLRRHAVFGFGPRALVRLLWQPGTGWSVWQGSGAASAATLQPDSYINPRLLVLNFRIDDGAFAGKRRSRALLGDELPEDSLRRLRALLLSVDTAAQPPDASG